MEPIILRIEEAARALGISRSYLYELIGRGELRVVKLGAATRIPRAELEAFVERLRQQPQGEAAPSAPEGRR